MIRQDLQWQPARRSACSPACSPRIALADWQIDINATLGFLYMFPLVLLGTVRGWWQLVLAAAFCTFLSDRLDPFPGTWKSARDILIFLTLVITGLLSLSVTKAIAGKWRAWREPNRMLARRARKSSWNF